MPNIIYSQPIRNVTGGKETAMNDTEIEELLVIAIGGLMIRSDKPHPTIGEIVDTILPLINKNQLALIEKIEGSLPKKVPAILVRENGDGSRTVQIDPRNQFIDEVTTLLKQAKEGL